MPFSQYSGDKYLQSLAQGSFKTLIALLLWSTKLQEAPTTTYCLSPASFLEQTDSTLTPVCVSHVLSNITRQDQNQAASSSFYSKKQWMGDSKCPGQSLPVDGKNGNTQWAEALPRERWNYNVKTIIGPCTHAGTSVNSNCFSRVQACWTAIQWWQSSCAGI